MSDRRLLVIAGAEGGGASFDDVLKASGIGAVRLDADDPKALVRAKDAFTHTPLAGVVLAGAGAAEKLFPELRHIAGADQSLLCLLPDTAPLRGLPLTAEGLARRKRWRDILAQADDVWTATPADAAWLKTLHPDVLARVVPRPGAEGADGWLAGRLAAVADATREKVSYGTPADLASIIVLTHNDGAYLKQCLASVRKHTPGPHEVIVVDNGTTNGSADFLKEAEGLRVLRSKRNVFFAAGCNLGLRAARGRYLVLLNADTAVTPGWLETLVRRVKRDPTVGLAGPYTNRAAGAQRIAKPGYRSLKGLDAFARRWAKEHSGGRLYPPRLDGFCLLIRRETLSAVGLLDERFGAGGYEDYDYCLRARQAGWRLLLAEEAYVHHHGGKGYAGQDYDKLREKNRRLLVEKWCQLSLNFLDEVW